jgi:hypothetical protein
MTIATRDETAILEQVLVNGDLSKLSGAERLQYYRKVCESVGLNPLTKPFDYITLQGKLSLYVNRSGTDQIREKHKVSVILTDKRSEEGLYIVSARATYGDRTDESTGAVPIEGLKGEARANAIMKAETKAKRRVTLSIVGLGWLDESEVDSIPGAQRVSFDEEPEHYVQRGPIPAPTQVIEQETDEIHEDEEGVNPIGPTKAKLLENRILDLGLTINDISNELDAQDWLALSSLTHQQAALLWKTLWQRRTRNR